MYTISLFWIFCLSFYLLIDGSNAGGTTKSLDYRQEECIAESKVDRNSVQRLRAGNWKKSDTALKKWTLCYLAKHDIMSRNGVLSQDVVLRNIPTKDKAHVEKVINKCLYKHAHDPIETAWHYLTCFHKNERKYAKLANLI
ncbi:unnamed protein product [Euphydryas editha]|uniref:Uncharacterized protein n=1 Tax=Euphydryas editha TaxID=104508 RepID=A0AAU9U703_EUPED|nr:unnamed protein product [Euphydryas editha]